MSADATEHRAARTRRVNHTLQGFVTEGRNAPEVATRFEEIDSVAAYNTAWEWAYASARAAYDAGKKEGRGA